MRDDRAYLADIQDQAEFISRQVKRVGRKAFFTDDVLVRAVLHSLLIIGEAANHLSAETVSGAPEVPWPKVVGLRNRIVHDYAGIDLELIWNVCERDIPVLRERVGEILDTGRP